MADVMSMFDSRFMQSFDLVDKGGKPKEYTLTIDRVEGGELTVAGGSKSHKPIVWFKGAKKGLALNKTNARTIITLYGRETNKWPGRLLTLYPTTTTFGRDANVPCIRIRPMIPKLGGGAVPPDVAPNREDIERKARAAEEVAHGEDPIR